LLVTIGTGGQVFAASTQPIFDLQGRIHTLPHALPDRRHALAAIPAAGRAIDWWCEIVGADPRAPVRPCSNPPVLVTAIAGERTPSIDETRTGELVGLTDAHTRDDTVFAVREGVAFAMRRCVEVLLELGIPTCGGGPGRAHQQVRRGVARAGNPRRSHRHYGRTQRRRSAGADAR